MSWDFLCLNFFLEHNDIIHIKVDSQIFTYGVIVVTLNEAEDLLIVVNRKCVEIFRTAERTINDFKFKLTQVVMDNVIWSQ